MSSTIVLSVMMLPILIFVGLIILLLIKCQRQLRQAHPPHELPIHNAAAGPQTQMHSPINHILIRSSEGTPGGAKIAFMPDGAMMFAQPQRSFNVDLQLDREVSTVIIYKTRSISPAPTELSDIRKSTNAPQQ
eukprot:TRINITY_DN154_c1_g1_i5.p2 TRINITY_DN154_c1_g1~~TRINITY_DN154_c1_g1_i5.p2  ORF type:complete len:133 (-),score=1.86 TRINITY_DN154_c1_g1_i5:662-1060(-)